jgi:hypothetical protein
MSGADERRALAEYLSLNLATDGAIMTSLRHATAEGGLIYRGGQWEFHGVKEALEANRGSADYYRQLLPELKPRARAVIQWLSCHRGPLPLDLLATISGAAEIDLNRAVAELRPYRLLDVTTSGGSPQVGFASEGVREAIYSTVDKKQLTDKHNHFIQHLESRSGGERSELESLTFHYEQAGRKREALLARVRSVRWAKRDGDVYAVRRLCEAGVAFARRGKSDWHLERFFIKEGLDAEWSVSNYSGILRIIDENFLLRKREVPVSFYYRYAYALDSAGQIGDLDRVMASIEDQNGTLPVSVINQLHVVKASNTRRRSGSLGRSIRRHFRGGC